MIKVERQHIDRAVEWVNVNHPDLEGAEYDTNVSAVAQEIAELDAECDRVEKLLLPL
jgi:hypothetical protein